MSEQYIPGLPGIRTARTADHRRVFKQGSLVYYLAGGKIIDGSKSRDPGNAPDVDILRAGLLMGKITASGKYAPSILGVTTVAYVDNDLTLTVGVATSVEIARRTGATTGTVNLLGPPTAAGTVASTAVAYTAVNQTTGVLTVPDLNVAAVAGSFILPNDGSQNPLTVIPDGWGIQVTDVDHLTNLDVEFPQLPVSGILESALIINWPTDTSLQAWLMDKLNDNDIGTRFVFDHAL